MMTPEFSAHVDKLLLEGNLGLALAPRLDDAPGAMQPVIGAPYGLEGLPGGAEGYNGPLQVALSPPEKMAVQSMMRATGADRGLDRTLGRMTGGEFKPDEIKMLEDRALAAAKWREVGQLKGISEGPPVILNAQQKATVDRLIGQLGSDHLAARARGAYGRAVSDGQIRVR
jgi:hypothetical protein